MEALSFIRRAIEFKCYDTKVVNLSRINPYCADLRFEVLFGDSSYQPNEYLTWDHEPLLCVSPVNVVFSNITEPRVITGSSDQYAIKDIRAQFAKYEIERLLSAIATVAGCDTIHVNGVASLDLLLIGISTRFTKVKTMRDRST